LKHQEAITSHSSIGVIYCAYRVSIAQK